MATGIPQFDCHILLYRLKMHTSNSCLHIHNYGINPFTLSNHREIRSFESFSSCGCLTWSCFVYIHQLLWLHCACIVMYFPRKAGLPLYFIMNNMLSCNPYMFCCMIMTLIVMMICSWHESWVLLRSALDVRLYFTTHWRLCSTWNNLWSLECHKICIMSRNSLALSVGYLHACYTPF